MNKPTKTWPRGQCGMCGRELSVVRGKVGVHVIPGSAGQRCKGSLHPPLQDEPPAQPSWGATEILEERLRSELADEGLNPGQVEAMVDFARTTGRVMRFQRTLEQVEDVLHGWAILFDSGAEAGTQRKDARELVEQLRELVLNSLYPQSKTAERELLPGFTETWPHRDHVCRQHRDMKPPWCPKCGRTENGSVPKTRLLGVPVS